MLVTVTYISWSSDFALHFQWMSVIFSDNETVWPKLWPQNKYSSTWLIYPGPVILLNVFKIIWWMNIIVCIMDQCDRDWPHQVYVGQWPIFYGPVILLLIWKTIWWRNIVFGIMDQWHKDQPCKIYVGQWSIFKCPLIMLYILSYTWIIFIF